MRSKRQDVVKRVFTALVVVIVTVSFHATIATAHPHEVDISPPDGAVGFEEINEPMDTTIYDGQTAVAITNRNGDIVGLIPIPTAQELTRSIYDTLQDSLSNSPNIKWLHKKRRLLATWWEFDSSNVENIFYPVSSRNLGNGICEIIYREFQKIEENQVKKGLFQYDYVYIDISAFNRFQDLLKEKYLSPVQVEMLETIDDYAGSIAATCTAFSLIFPPMIIHVAFFCLYDEIAGNLVESHEDLLEEIDALKSKVVHHLTGLLNWRLQAKRIIYKNEPSNNWARKTFNCPNGPVTLPGPIPLNPNGSWPQQLNPYVPPDSIPEPTLPNQGAETGSDDSKSSVDRAIPKIICPPVAFANGTIVGSVRSTDDKPVSDTYISMSTIDGTVEGIKTNEKGSFKFKVPIAELITFSVVGLSNTIKTKIVPADKLDFPKEPPEFIEPGKDCTVVGNYPISEYIEEMSGKSHPIPEARSVSEDGKRAVTTITVPSGIHPGKGKWIMTDASGDTHEFEGSIYHVLSARIDDKRLSSGQNAEVEYEFDFGKDMANREVMIEPKITGPIELIGKRDRQYLPIDDSGHASFEFTVRAKKVAPGTEIPFSISHTITRYRREGR